MNWRAAVLLLVTACIAGCTSPAREGGQPFGPATDIPTPSPTVSAADTLAPTAHGPAGFAFPTGIDPTGRYMFYLHGKIVEDQGIPATSPEYGEYQYEEILETLRSYGFVVISE